MKHASLFTGIGGFDLAASWMGWENIFQCEIDAWCIKVLTKNFPDTIRYADIKQTDFSIWNGEIDILTGGFPCQSFSVAGKGAADITLWKEMFRAITEIKPPFVVAENVPGIVSIKDGMVFDLVCSDLESAGYQVQPLNLPIAGQGAPHKRERIWFVAYSDSFRCHNEQKEHGQPIYNGKRNGEIEEQIGRQQQCRLNESDSGTTECNSGNTTNSTSKRFSGIYQSEQREQLLYAQRRSWEESWVEAATRLCGVDARIPGRVDRIKGLGNSIAPIIVLEIFKALEDSIKISTS